MTVVSEMKNAIEMSHYKYGWANKTYPEFADAQYIPTDSDKSIGLVGGISYKELME